MANEQVPSVASARKRLYKAIDNQASTMKSIRLAWDNLMAYYRSKDVLDECPVCGYGNFARFGDHDDGSPYAEECPFGKLQSVLEAALGKERKDSATRVETPAPEE